MNHSALNVSENFRKMAVRSVLSIILFLFAYIVLVILALGIIALCGFIAYGLTLLKAMFITLMMGLGFIGMGFLIFFFLIKFVFSSPKKVDRSHLLEINEKDQPELFRLIREIVNEVKTQFPKKIYLSSDVNAAVFYDSSFWSMFFPVKKNLQIGLGLMNSVSAIELKAILAHEFGHFSQRSMKVGSYVYNVNKVIYNMLYDNDQYADLLNRWSNVSSYFVLFARGSILVIQGIQYVLTKVYRILNLNYMALSREMEFHADAVAASVTGSQPLASSLLRLGLAERSLHVVLNHYNEKIAQSQRPANLYPQQAFVLSRIASVESIPTQDGLPDLSVEIYKKFNKTKLVLDDQWSSHPSTEQRIAHLSSLNLPLKSNLTGIAIDLLNHKEAIQEAVTAKLFEGVSFENTPVTLDSADFRKEYMQQEEENAYPAVFQGYFDTRDPYSTFSAADFETVVEPELDFHDLINEQSAADINSLSMAIADKDVIDGIYNGNIETKTFDYDGIKYSALDAHPLISFLDTEIVRLNAALSERDAALFRFFLGKAAAAGKTEEFKTPAIAYQKAATLMQEQRDAYVNLASATYFMQRSTPFEQIRENMVHVKKTEIPFKKQVGLLLEDPQYQDLIDAGMRAEFEEYLATDWKYFGYDIYFDKEVDALFKVMLDFSITIFKLQTQLKRSLLNFQANLL